MLSVQWRDITNVFMLALTIWREARGESHTAKVAVGFSILNRVAKPKWWGNTILTVVTKKWQYSSLTNPKDFQLAKWPTEDDATWQECVLIAMALLDDGGGLTNPVPGADSYYDDSISAPYWTKGARFVAKIDSLNFYDVDHDYEKEVVA